MAAAHLSLKRLSSFSRSWIALCFTFDWSRSLSAASILQLRVSVFAGTRDGTQRGAGQRRAQTGEHSSGRLETRKREQHTHAGHHLGHKRTRGAHLFWLEVRIRCMRSSSSSSSSSSPAALTSVTSGM